MKFNIEVFRAALQAHRWLLTVALMVLATLVSALAGLAKVSVPLVDDPVPLWMMLTGAVSVIVLQPLLSTFPDLEPTLTREPTVRAARIIIAHILAAASLSPILFQMPPGAPRRVLIGFACGVTAIGVVGVILVGELAWVPVVTVTLVAIIANGTIGQPVSRALALVDPREAGAAPAIAALIYWWRGPSR